MAKEAYYFSHDSNARHDPDIKAMRSVYKLEGYAWFWVLVEMMRDADEHKLSMQGRYIWNAYASELECDAETAKRFVEDCIHEFCLFASDGNFFWSDSLLRRMKKKTATSEKRSAAANARWEKTRTNTGNYANQMQNGSYVDANAMQGKESKEKESKGNEIKAVSNAPTAPAQVFNVFEREGFGTLSSVLMDDLNDLIDSYSSEWVIEAMKESARSGRRNLKYTIAILKRWKAEGIDSPWKGDERSAEPRGRDPRSGAFAEYDRFSL